MWLARPHIQSKHVWSMAEAEEGMTDGSPGTWLPLPERAQDGASLVCHQHTHVLHTVLHYLFIPIKPTCQDLSYIPNPCVCPIKDEPSEI